jgi:hypothetical protein
MRVVLVDEALPHPPSSVWRCLRGDSRSASSHPSIVDFHPSITGDARTAGFRAGGTGDANASRIVRRWVPNRDASSRIDTVGSSRRARRICSNNSTLNLFAMNPPSTAARPLTRTPSGQRGGAKSDEHKPPLKVGPKQMSTPRASSNPLPLQWRELGTG